MDTEISICGIVVKRLKNIPNLSFSPTSINQAFTSLDVHDLMVDWGEASTTSITVATIRKKS